MSTKRFCRRREEKVMKYEKLSKRALGCMYTATWIGIIIAAGIVAAVNFMFFVPREIQAAQTICWCILGFLVISGIVSPWFRFHRYGYSINDECIDIREGYIFVERNIVPIERLHKLQTNRGPIDQLFGVSKVIVTTAGGDVVIRFLEERQAEEIADMLRKRINEVALKEKGGEANGKQ